MTQGLRVESVGGAFTLGGRRYPIGTALVRTAGNPADLHARMTALATAHGAEVVPIDSAYVEAGTSLGSPENGFVKAPRVLLAWDLPTSSLSAGWTRYVLERRFGQAVTTVRTASLGRVDFADYDVLVLPSGNYAGQIDDAVLNRLKDWLRARRHAGDAGRSHAVGGRQRRGPARHQRAAQGRPARYVPATTGAAPSGGASGAAAASSGSRDHAGRERRRRAAGVRQRGCAAPSAARIDNPSPLPESRAPGTRAPTMRPTTRRSSPNASGPTRSPARCCGPPSTPITG